MFSGPADTASQPVVTIAPIVVPSYRLNAPANVTYTDTTYRVTWSGPVVDRIVLSYVINGKEFFIINVLGTGSFTYWRPPYTPDPANTRDSVFHNVRLKAVWQNRTSSGTYRNISTQTSDYFTIARPGQFVILNQSLPPAYVGRAYRVNLQAENGVKPYYWSLASGLLPSGLTMNNDGQIRGTPTSATVRTFKVHTCDSGVDAATDDMVLTVNVLEQPGQPTTAPEPFDFELDPLTDVTLNRPAEGYNTVTVHYIVNTLAGTPETVTLELTGCPTQGVNYAFVPRTGLPSIRFSGLVNITASNTAPTGVYDLTVHARSTGGVERARTFRLNITDVGTSGDIRLKQAYRLGNDLENSHIMPVQVLDNMEFIVRGKNTIFYATLESTFSDDTDVYVELWLPTDDWTWAGQRTDVARGLRTGAMGTYTCPEHYVYGTTVTVPANGEVELILPDPAGLVNETVHSSGHRIYDVYDVVTNAPRPAHASGGDPLSEPVYTVVVDPLGRITEDDEQNNYPPLGYERMMTVDSRRLNVLFTPFLSDSYDVDDFWPGGVGGTAFVNDLANNMTPLARGSMEYMIGVYPLSDQGKLSYYLNLGIVTGHAWGANDDREQVHLAEDLADMAAENGYDRVVGLVPVGWYPSSPEWGGIVWNSNSRACFVRVGASGLSTVTHENYHNLGYHDIDSVTNNRDFPADDGYWVNKQQVKDVVHDDVRDYMDYTSQPRWTTENRYKNVMNGLPASDDPPVLLFRCLLDKNGGITVKPFSIFDGWPDVEPAEWTHRIVLKNGGGSVVREQKVNVSFTVSLDILDDQAAGVERPVDEAFISATVPWSSDVATIELRDRAGALLVERKVSQNAPSVDISEPAPGTVWNYGDKYPVKWTGSDPDGDLLNYSLSISDDKANWLPVAIDIRSAEYWFDTKAVGAGNYYFRVRATDGVLSASDVMDQGFEVRVTGPVSTATPKPASMVVPASTETPDSTLEPGAIAPAGGSVTASPAPSTGISSQVMLLGGGVATLAVVGVIILMLRRKK